MPLTALIVIAAIVLFFALLLHMKLRAEVRFIGGELDFKVKYFFLTLYPLRKKEKKRRKKGKAPPGEEAAGQESPPAEEGTASAEDTPQAAGQESTEAAEDMSGNGKKEKLSDKLDKLSGFIEKVKIIWGFSNKGLKKIFTHIYIDDLMIDFIIAGEDACKTAQTYGAVSGAVYSVIAVLATVFSVKVKTVDIGCDFNRKEPVWDCSVKITARPSTLLSAAMGILFGFLKNYNKIIDKKTKAPA